MRRRNPTLLRQPRRRYTNLVWLALCGFVILLFFIVLLRKDNQPTSKPAITQVSVYDSLFFFLVSGVIDFWSFWVCSLASHECFPLDLGIWLFDL